MRGARHSSVRNPNRRLPERIKNGIKRIGTELKSAGVPNRKVQERINPVSRDKKERIAES